MSMGRGTKTKNSDELTEDSSSAVTGPNTFTVGANMCQRLNREIALRAIKQDGTALKFVSDELKKDREIVLAAVKQEGYSLRYASNELKQDYDIVLAAVQHNGFSLQFASDELKNDRGIVMAAVNSDGVYQEDEYAVLQFASNKLRNDREIVLAAVQVDGWAFEFASDELKKDREIFMTALQAVPYALRFATRDVRKDPDIVTMVMKADWNAVWDVFDMERDDWGELTKDPDIVMAAVTQFGGALEHASEELKNNREIVMAAVRAKRSDLDDSDPQLALEFASDELKKDCEVVMAAVKTHGLALAYASDELRKDHDIVLAAVQNRGNSLNYALGELNNDRGIVMAAVMQEGGALIYASQRLRADPVIVANAVTTYPAVIECAEPTVFLACPLLSAVKMLQESNGKACSDEEKRAWFQGSLDQMIRLLNQWSEVAAVLARGTALSDNDKEWIEKAVVAPLHHPGGLIESDLKRNNEQLFQ